MKVILFVFSFFSIITQLVYNKFKEDFPSTYDEFMTDKSLIRAWFSTEAIYSTFELFQAIFYLIIYYFFLGYFTNIFLIFCTEED